MLLNFLIENFEVFSEAVQLNLEANLHTKKLLSNVVLCNQGNALKSLAIYGPNNTGKTCIIDAIAAFRDVILNKPFRYTSNVFTNSSIVRLAAEFLFESIRYYYSFSYDTEQKAFSHERFCRVEIDDYGNRRELVYYDRDIENKKANSLDGNLKAIIPLSSKDSTLIYSFDTDDLPLLQEAKRVLRSLGESMVILSLDHLSPIKTIEVLKKRNSPEAKKVVNLIKAADLDIDDYIYAEAAEINLSIEEDDGNERLLKAIRKSDRLMDQLRLVSVHRGKPLPSISFDSQGTKKIIALASYLVEALEKKQILILDELDSGLQFKLTRAIISMFNSFLNTSAQLICSTHDVSLLDIKTLFRKDQIWFTDKDEKQAYLYSLSNFTSENSGIRSDSDIVDKYSRGVFGALPDPTLIDALLNVEDGELV